VCCGHCMRPLTHKSPVHLVHFIVGILIIFQEFIFILFAFQQLGNLLAGPPTEITVGCFA
jgi:hypothetical protein